jgi:hypothetical protein
MRRRLTALLLCCVLVSASAPVYAQASDPDRELGMATSGLPGLVNTGLPVSDPALRFAGSANYGITESQPPVDGAHHRVGATAAAAFAPEPWLAFTLRMDGRLDLHPNDGRGAHGTGVGDPRIAARAGHALASGLQLGGELGLWFPGNSAPSISPKATTVDARGLIAYAPHDSRMTLLGALGFRLDNSGNSAPDLSRLRSGDRLALGLSDSHAVLIALGGAYRASKDVEVFGELSGDLLIGSDAPKLTQSPLRIAAGGRYFFSRALQAELTSIISLSGRPETGPTDPLVPIEPRFAIVAGVRYALRLGEAKAKAKHDDLVPPDEARSTAATTPSNTTATLEGVITDDQNAPLPEAHMKASAGGEVRETITDGEGRYQFADLPVGTVMLEASATGFETQSWQVELSGDKRVEEPRALAPEQEMGVLRGLTRSFGSTPLRAHIVVRDEQHREIADARADEHGRFEIEIAPGKYQVTITATGYRTHSRSVTISNNGVAILNVDMRELK